MMKENEKALGDRRGQTLKAKPEVLPLGLFRETRIATLLGSPRNHSSRIIHCAGNAAQMIECLFSKREVLGSIPDTA